MGLYRIEDITIGVAVSVGVGLFFWPRGAAVVDLWAGVDPGTTNARAHRDLADEARRVERWYDSLGAALDGHGEVPDPVEESPEFDHLLVDTVDDDLRVTGGDSAATDVRLVWTKDYLGVARRLEATLVDPATSALQRRSHPTTPPSGVEPTSTT